MPYERLLVSADSDAEDSDAEESTSTANQVPVGLTGKQSGKVLASFLLSERDNSAFAKAFENGIMAWLKKEQPKYNLYPSAPPRRSFGLTLRPSSTCPSSRLGWRARRAARHRWAGL